MQDQDISQDTDTDDDSKWLGLMLNMAVALQEWLPGAGQLTALELLCILYYITHTYMASVNKTKLTSTEVAIIINRKTLHS